MGWKTDPDEFHWQKGHEKKQTPSEDIHIFTLKCHVWQSLSCLFELYGNTVLFGGRLVYEENP